MKAAVLSAHEVSGWPRVHSGHRFLPPTAVSSFTVHGSSFVPASGLHSAEVPIRQTRVSLPSNRDRTPESARESGQGRDGSAMPVHHSTDQEEVRK